MTFLKIPKTKKLTPKTPKPKIKTNKKSCKDISNEKIVNQIVLKIAEIFTMTFSKITKISK